MKIIVLGAGQVGAGIARDLLGEANDLTLVDHDTEVLRSLQERLDIRTVTGNAASPQVLTDAGIEDADLLLAVTSRDEINMIACQVAHSLFHTTKCIARVRAADFLAFPDLFSKSAIPVDYLISPEELVTTHIRRLIESPGVLQSLNFIEGRARMVAVEAKPAGSLVGCRLDSLQQRMPEPAFRVVAIYRDGGSIELEPETTIRVGDDVFFITARQHVPAVMQGFRQSSKPNRRIIIAGGGNIGERLAASIENEFRVKLIEIDADHGRQLAEQLHKTIILHGDGADADLLRQENIENTDVFCAVTNDDEANILSSMLAKRLGARKTICVINRSSYVDIAQGTAVDIAVSPAQVTIGALLSHIRRGDVLSVYSLRRGAAEAMEVIVHGDRRTSRLVSRRIRDLPLPHGVRIGAIERNERLFFPDDETVIESGDHLVLFIVDKRRVREIEPLFQVGVTFV